MWSKPSVISWMVGVALAMAPASLPAQEAATPAGRQVPIPATGEYASIDVRLLNDSVRILETGDASARKAKAAEIRASPEQFAPPVFYALSNVLFDEGQEDEAMFWFYAGQLIGDPDATSLLEKVRMSRGLKAARYVNNAGLQCATNLETGR